MTASDSHAHTHDDVPGAEAEKWSRDEKTLIEDAESSLAEALELWNWWCRTDADDSYSERFLLSTTFHRSDSSFGFFGDAEILGRKIEIMGNVQEQFFDRPKLFPPDADESLDEIRNRTAVLMRDQVREFVLRYFLSISDFRPPEATPTGEGDGSEPQEIPSWMRPLSWCPTHDTKSSGFGYAQVFYKTRDGKVGKFSGEDRFAIVDLRELHEKYAWVVFEVDIFDFSMEIAPFGQKSPRGVVPMPEASYVVISPELIVNDDDPGPGELGRYGFAYGFLPKNDPGLLAYGPGRFEVAFQLIQFIVKDTGEIIAQMAFAANRPEKIVDFSLDPVRWGLRAADLFSMGSASRFLGPLTARMPRPPGVDVVSGYMELANLVTGGMARRRLCVTRKQLEREFLVMHFRQHYNVIASSLVTWRQFPNWLDRDSLPEWVTSGISS